MSGLSFIPLGVWVLAFMAALFVCNFVPFAVVFGERSGSRRTAVWGSSLVAALGWLVAVSLLG